MFDFLVHFVMHKLYIRSQSGFGGIFGRHSGGGKVGIVFPIGIGFGISGKLAL
ncbi:MAG: hypothetical protein IPN66_14540 [Candidatus Competibacteraceae bacterium]|nr:hypothetical protein [Candidatus Competibacteraceae bacterium]